MTGTFTLSAPLVNTGVGIRSPLSYSFSDGLQTLTNLNSNIEYFVMGADTNGKIGNWLINVISRTNSNNSILMVNEPQIGPDMVSFNRGAGDVYRAGTLGRTPPAPPAPAPTPVPEPSSILLLGTGLLSTAGVLRHRLHQIESAPRAVGSPRST